VRPHDLAYLIDTLSQIADIVVVDVPCTYDDLYFKTLAAAGQTVLVGEHSLTSTRALKLVHEALSGTGKVGGRDQLVIKRYDPKNTPFSANRLLEPIGLTSLFTIARDDARACAALHKCRPIRLVTLESKDVADIVALAHKLLSPGAPPNTTSGGLLGRMRRAFSNT
jgi:Flp pilus assembly CpaE family ATPase